MTGEYKNTEAVIAEIDRSIELAKHCQHEHTKFVEVAPFVASNGIVIDAETVEVCTSYWCGAIVRSGL